MERLLRAYTSDLSLSDRFRKRLLLGAVDVPASRFDAPPKGGYWYVGTLERDEAGALWLRTGGERELWFEVPDSLVEIVDALPHLARVHVDGRGVPVGPVSELRPGFRGDEDALWAEWRRRVGDDDG